MLHDAIHSFCAIRAGKPAADIDPSRSQELIDPIHSARLDEHIKVTCLTREGARTTVNGDAFVDDETWRSAVYFPSPVPTSLKIAAGRGHLIVVQADFNDMMWAGNTIHYYQ